MTEWKFNGSVSFGLFIFVNKYQKDYKLLRHEYGHTIFIEAKKTQLNLHDLGQLWAYCKLCDPLEAFLLSSTGIGSLNKILNNLNRINLLEFGDKKIYKYMKIGKWDVFGKSIDYKTVVPK